MALLLADGQLAGGSATVLGAGAEDRIVQVTLFNTSLSSPQTVSLTVTRSNGTARTVAYAVLEGHETMLVRGLPLDPSAVLAGEASAGATVDYLISKDGGSFGIEIRDANGAPKASQTVTVTLPDRGIDAGAQVQIGLLEEIRDLLVKIA